MEISLLSKHGITDNSILSIRAGSVKRQAPINSGRAFRFPKLGMEENPVRVAILHQVGSAYLITKPDECRYQVVFDHGGSCEVEVRASTENAEEPKAGETEEKENSSSAKEAKEYLEQHQLLQFVQGVLQAVIKDKPKNPFTYMARHFMSGYESEKERESKDASPEEQTPATVVTSEAAPAAEDKTPAPATEDTTPPAPAREAKGEALEAVPAEVASQKASAPTQTQPCAAPAKEEGPGPLGDESFNVEALRVQVQDTLMKATQNGTLSKSLEVVRPIAAPNNEQVQPPQATQAEQPSSDLRLRMKETLLRATEDGSLVGAMQTVMTEQKTETAADSQVIPTEELIKQVQETFSKAEQDGTLGAALERAISRDKEQAVGTTEGTTEDLRARARAALQEACKNGTAEEVLQEVVKDTAKESDTLEELKTKAASALAHAVNSGSLGGTLEAVIAEGAPGGADELQDLAGPQIDDLRVRMKDTLLSATNDGSLQTAIEKALHDTKEAELRTKAVGALAGAADAGTLEGALKEARAQGPEAVTEHTGSSTTKAEQAQEPSKTSEKYPWYPSGSPYQYNDKDVLVIKQVKMATAGSTAKVYFIDGTFQDVKFLEADGLISKFGFVRHQTAEYMYDYDGGRTEAEYESVPKEDPDEWVEEEAEPPSYGPCQRRKKGGS